MGESRGIAPPGAVVIGGRRIALLDRARVYACGITPYDVTHLGHAATFVWVDVLGRVLRHLGVEPDICRNVTDVDDVLDAAADRAGSRYDTFAAIQQFEFQRDMAALNVRVPSYEPRAHSYVRHVVRLAAGLLDAGAAYVRRGSVYFRGRAVADRAGLDHAEAVRLSAEYGGRPDDPAKDDPLDVALWQAAEPGHPAWDSPWGPGRPGWHAECVAMALSVFGLGVDVHAGGADLRFPHHAYHAAMAEAFTGVTPYARAWLHAGTVTVGGTRMAKSAGNLVMLDDLLADHPAGAVRLMILDRPWAQSWDYTPERLAAATRRLEDLYRAAGRTTEVGAPAVAETRRRLAGDLDVSGALDVAIDAGGAPARLLATTLGLT
ncbi:cysteine--tRNA ligase [Gandjariella thermophila]|uniref:Cysteine--tRNA ligase n=1 Tax=Gandjariella thermophila TaxID=1931992 RepID=A0A4D4J522_9PSEU|nr:cysteine--tRNA ligase [Gandjariella thermophila]GDY31621.1 cysteine--tRNA ligase [Gandjariella thermophila]